MLEARERTLGRCRVDALELVINDWYHRQAEVRRIARFALRPRSSAD